MPKKRRKTVRKRKVVKKRKVVRKKKAVRKVKRKVAAKPKKRVVRKVRKVKARAKPKKKVVKKTVIQKARPVLVAKLVWKPVAERKPAFVPKAAPTNKGMPVTLKGAGPKPVAKITHYYDRIGVAVLKLAGTIRVGDRIKVKQGDHEFTQTVQSMQINHAAVKSAGNRDDVGLKLDKPVHEGAKVYLT